MNSKEKLASALKSAGAPEYMIKKAAQGHYSDYESPLAMPIAQLIADCAKLGLTLIAEQAKEGRFDATKAESDAWYEREGKDLIAGLGNTP